MNSMFSVSIGFSSVQNQAEFMVPSLKASRPGPEAAQEPQTVTLPSAVLALHQMQVPCLPEGSSPENIIQK